MGRRRGACAKLRASRGVLRHAPRGESTVAGFWARNIILFLSSMRCMPGFLRSSKHSTDAIGKELKQTIITLSKLVRSR
uniref:Uncharacterized protein n=1 Tax=Meloidogyne incognita TaxID=6306 RepID=A0A914MHJ4_MELIC